MHHSYHCKLPFVPEVILDYPVKVHFLQTVNTASVEVLDHCSHNLDVE